MSRISIQQADAFHTERQNAAWDQLADAAKAAALAKADDYIDAFYAPLKPGVDGDNQRLVIAISMLALELQTNPVAVRAEQPIKERSIKSDGDESKTVYQDADKAPLTDPYPLVTAIIAPIRANGGPSGLSFGLMVN